MRLLDEVMPRGGAPVESRLMFGSPCYWTGGRMIAGVHQDVVFVRLGEAGREALLAQPGAHLFEPMKGRPMREYVAVPEAVLQDSDALTTWLARGVAYTAGLPPKQKKPRKKRG